MKSKNVITAFMIALILAILAAACCFAAPYDGSKPATREEALENLLSAAYGCYYWQGEGDATPFLPRGFPQWNMSVQEVKELLGEPASEGTVFGLSTLGYDEFEIIVKNDKFAGVKSSVHSHKWLSDYGSKVVGWNLKNQASGSGSIYGTRFATAQSHSPRYSVTAWLVEEGPEEGSYIALQDVAQELGVTW